MNASDIHALVTGNYDDIYSVLGMHHQDKGLVVRALVPGAESVDVIASRDGCKLATLERLHVDGLFSGLLEGHENKFSYRFRVK